MNVTASDFQINQIALVAEQMDAICCQKLSEFVRNPSNRLYTAQKLSNLLRKEPFLIGEPARFGAGASCAFCCCCSYEEQLERLVFVILWISQEWPPALRMDFLQTFCKDWKMERKFQLWKRLSPFINKC
jgi:hypothetical protein